MSLSKVDKCPWMLMKSALLEVFLLKNQRPEHGLLIMGSRVRVPPGSPLVLIGKFGPAPRLFGGAGTGSVSTGKTSDIYRSRAQPTHRSFSDRSVFVISPPLRSNA